MYWRDIGYLCKSVERINALGKPYASFEYREVFCNSKGIKRNEFYQANAQGYKPELCVVIREESYDHEEHFEYGGILYRIIRTYPVEAECLELICQSLASEGRRRFCDES